MVRFWSRLHSSLRPNIFGSDQMSLSSLFPFKFLKFVGVSLGCGCEIVSVSGVETDNLKYLQVTSHPWM